MQPADESYPRARIDIDSVTHARDPILHILHEVDSFLFQTRRKRPLLHSRSPTLAGLYAMPAQHIFYYFTHYYSRSLRSAICHYFVRQTLRSPLMRPGCRPFSFLSLVSYTPHHPWSLVSVIVYLTFALLKTLACTENTRSAGLFWYSFQLQFTCTPSLSFVTFVCCIRPCPRPLRPCSRSFSPSAPCESNDLCDTIPCKFK
jgi:hypothetical protein